MYKILILAYLIGQDPLATQKTFTLDKNFESMEKCKKELLLKTKDNNTYDVLYDFVVKNEFKYDWLVAGCKNEKTGEEFIIRPSYPEGKPEELQNFKLEKKLDNFL